MAIFTTALALILIPASASAGSDSGKVKIYKGTNEHLKVSFRVKGNKVELESAKYRRTCTGTQGGPSSHSDGPTKIRRGGRIHFLFEEDFGIYMHIELRARIEKGTIRGTFTDTYRSYDQGTDHEEECWTGKSFVDSKLKFKARFVR